MAHLLTLYSQSKQSDLQQRCLEFLQLAREGPAAMAAVLPVDASCEDVEVRLRSGAGSMEEIKYQPQGSSTSQSTCQLVEL